MQWRHEEALEQRVQKFEFQHLDGGQWQTIFTGTTIGRWFQRTFAPVRGQAIRLNILDAKEDPTITDIELFEK